MAVTFGVMAPHPPIILPEVGRGEERKIAATSKAYEQAAERIAHERPDTIVIASPHSVMYSDYFHISPGKTAYGDMGQFRAEGVKFQEEYDEELVNLITDLAKEEGFPAGTLGEREKRLDHGTMIPLYFIRKKYTDFKIVRIGLSGLSLAEHYHLGQLVKMAADRLSRNIVFVASGDLSHKLKEDGPYGFAKEGVEYDARIMKTMGEGRFDELFDYDEAFCDRAAECGHRSFVILAGAFDGVKVRTQALSHEDTFGVGYGICTFSPEGADDGRRFLEIRQKRKLEELAAGKNRESLPVKIARLSLESYVGKNGRISAKEAVRALGKTAAEGVDLDELEQLQKRKAGAFVSLHKDGRLRGCIGTILPTKDSLVKEILDNAISAASADPRFSPVREEEIPFLEYSVDVLGEPEDIPDSSFLDVKRYGVIVSHGIKRGLLLPDLEGVDTVEEQIEIARRKGNIREDEPYSLQRFEVVRYK